MVWKGTKQVLVLAGAVAMVAAVAPGRVARADFWTLTNPHWEITLTDAGYSDYLGDQAPGFMYREYLSGEWGAAVSYKQGGVTVTPTWLEHNFIYPDWTTNSNFMVDTAITPGPNTAQGLPTADSILHNNEIQVALHFEMIDTGTGIRMGMSPASAGGAGASRVSDRYVLQQTYTITNRSATESITDLALFQFLHGLESQSAVYDNRNYGGNYAAYRYDINESGQSNYGVGKTLDDVIGFGSDVAPDAYEVGHYGVTSVDNHWLGKPSVGTHYSVENDNLNGADWIGPPTEQWVAGAEKWSLGTLAAGGSISRSVLLSISTGSFVDSGAPGTGHIDDNTGGGGGASGGEVDYDFGQIDTPGLFSGIYNDLNEQSINDWVDQGVFTAPSFIFGAKLQVWDLSFTGAFSGSVTLVFHYDPQWLPSGADMESLSVYHFNGESWDRLSGVVDSFNQTITVSANSFSPFALGFGPTVPEPASALVLLFGAALLFKRGGARAVS